MSEKIECKYIPWNKVEREKLNDLIDREMVVGNKLMLARVFLKKGAHVPMHQHHNEQVTYILDGALKFAIDPLPRKCAKGCRSVVVCRRAASIRWFEPHT